MEFLLIGLGLLLLVVGLVGCIVPVLPGPPLSALGLVALWAARGWEAETFGGDQLLNASSPLLQLSASETA